MNILLASDNNYAPLLGVTIYSLLENNENDFENIAIYILDGGISEVNKNKIREIFSRDKNFFLGLFKPKSKYLGEIIPLNQDGIITEG